MIISTSSFVAALIATAVSSALVGHTLTVSQRREHVPHHNFVDVNPCNFCDYNASDEGFHPAEQDSNFIRL